MRVLHKLPDRTLFTPHFPAPVPPLAAGDTLVICQPMVTMRGETYAVGDTLEIVERTTRAPHRITTTEGNLRVRGKDGAVTVWSSVEWGMAGGNIKRLTPS